MFIQIEAFAFINTDLFNDATGALIEAVNDTTDFDFTYHNPLMDEIKLNSAAIDAAIYELQNLYAAPVVVFPYKRKYTTADEIYRVLATTSCRKEVASLYYVNAELIQHNKELSKAFINRKAAFYPTQQAVA